MRTAFPLGAQATLDDLERDPHELLARLRASEPVSWVAALDGWLVTRHDLALRVMRDAATFTVDDARFSTGQVVGPSMLSRDGDEHARHREPFVAPFRVSAVAERFTGPVREETERLIDALAPEGGAELRRAFAGPLAASIVTRALGLEASAVPAVLDSYDAIVGAVGEITAGRALTEEARRAFSWLRSQLEAVIDGDDRSSLLAAAAGGTDLTPDQIVANAAVLLFGGIETTEGMIANAILLLLEHPNELALVREDLQLLDRAIEESLRLEPAAAVIDRYATVDATLASAHIGRGELVRVSISAANRDPAVFIDPDRFKLDRVVGRRHLAFAHGPHVCVGVHLARLEARTALAALLRRLPGLRLDPHHPAAVRGLVFRKPPVLRALWDRHQARPETHSSPTGAG
jgi:cytochrome P450